jgi:hypothetical protein
MGMSEIELTKSGKIHFPITVTMGLLWRLDERAMADGWLFYDVSIAMRNGLKRELSTQEDLLTLGAEE